MRLFSTTPAKLDLLLCGACALEATACLKAVAADDEAVEGGASGNEGKGVCVLFGLVCGREESLEFAASAAATGFAGSEG